jgi:hypothetical protein
MKTKKYKVNIDMIYSIDIKLSAKNSREAKKKAWDKFSKRKPNSKLFKIYVDEA